MSPGDSIVLSSGSLRATLLATVAFSMAFGATRAQIPTIVEPDPNAACDASLDSPDATCATCYKQGNTAYQVCCCTPYPALVTSEAVGGSSCTCSNKAGWALILMAVLVPILVICDIMLVCYCCYRGKCCCFSSSVPEKTEYNIHDNAYLADNSAQTTFAQPSPHTPAGVQSVSSPGIQPMSPAMPPINSQAHPF